MKKLIVTMVTAALVALGLVASTGAAQAACPYTACVNTTVSVSAPSTVASGNNARLIARVSAPGNVRPTGKIIFTVKRQGGGYTLKQSRAYVGGRTVLFTGKLNRPGRYTVTAKFVPNPNSVFNGDSDTTTLRVRR